MTQSPIFLQPEFKERIWGERLCARHLAMTFPLI
ncbi:hypothetical protein RSC3_03981 [Bacillus paralicheniformis]|nr:hypothetical protein RSC3_03981 [Bacillus paralicheniformis]